MVHYNTTASGAAVKLSALDHGQTVASDAAVGYRTLDHGQTAASGVAVRLSALAMVRRRLQA